MSGLLTGEQKHQANFLLGPWGVLSCQFVNYYTWYEARPEGCYGDDNLRLRIVVGVLILLTVLKSIHAFAVLWINFIVYFGALEDAILLSYTAWWQSGTPLMVAVVGFLRPILFLLPSLGNIQKVVCRSTDCDYIPLCLSFHRGRVAAHLSATFSKGRSSGDIILSFTTAYFLLKTKKDVLPETVGLISALVRLTFQTGRSSSHLPRFLVTRLTTPRPALPKLYAISMMWTLNARRSIRAEHSSRTGMNHQQQQRAVRRTLPRSAAPKKPLLMAGTYAQGDMELGAIQIVTQTETTHHVDVRDMFEPVQKHSKHSQQTDTRRSDESLQFFQMRADILFRCPG
ncbi:hypothetical protein B0H12DRAFT_1078126 [Mycena haematopus]|nr:hypothetical protein B0H12DRAFT_1078126 [Mycena haematopus]